MRTFSRSVFAVAPLVAALSASAAEITLPLKEAWFDGLRIGEISTDVSDPNLERTKIVVNRPFARAEAKSLPGVH